jgi:hypothetical protein
MAPLGVARSAPSAGKDRGRESRAAVDFSVITEQRVSATQIGDLGYTEVVRDFEKLSAILDAA